MKNIKIISKGKVQGVGFRFFVKQEASKRKLFGYTKNLQNGNVETVVSGDENILDDFVKSLKIGPPASRVSETKITELEVKESFSNFEIRY